MNNMKTFITLALVCFLATTVDAQVKKPTVKKTTTQKSTVKKTTKPVAKTVKQIPGTRIKITTDSGVVIVRLYDKTPLHRDNFFEFPGNSVGDGALQGLCGRG